MKCECGNEFKQYKTTEPKCPACRYKQLIGEVKTVKSAARFNWRKDKPQKKSSKSLARDNADKWTSRYIRLKHSEVDGEFIYCTCFTCGTPHAITNIDAGHFINRGNNSVRYSVSNIRPQCKKCNRFKSGEHFIFEKNLIKEIGQDQVDSLKRLADERGEDSEQYYKEVAEHFKIKAREIQEKLGVKIW